MQVNFPEMISEIVSVHVPKILSGVVKPILFHGADWRGVSVTVVCVPLKLWQTAIKPFLVKLHKVKGLLFEYKLPSSSISPTGRCWVTVRPRVDILSRAFWCILYFPVIESLFVCLVYV